jgi:hypothetical protein
VERGAREGTGAHLAVGGEGRRSAAIAAARAQDPRGKARTEKFSGAVIRFGLEK